MNEKVELSRTQIVELISQWIHNERDRKILLRRMCDGITYETLSEEFELSVQQTKRIVYKGKEIIYRHVPKMD